MNDQKQNSQTPPLDSVCVSPRKPWRDYEWVPPVDSPVYPRPEWDEIPKDYRRIIGSLPTVSGSVSHVTLQPDKGQKWYVKDASTQLLVVVKVIDVTPKTIEIEIPHPQLCLGVTNVRAGRYQKGFLVFVERVADAEGVESV